MSELCPTFFKKVGVCPEKKIQIFEKSSDFLRKFGKCIGASQQTPKIIFLESRLKFKSANCVPKNNFQHTVKGSNNLMFRKNWSLTRIPFESKHRIGVFVRKLDFKRTRVGIGIFVSGADRGHFHGIRSLLFDTLLFSLQWISKEVSSITSPIGQRCVL